MAQIQNTYQHFGTNDTVTATSLNDLIDKAVLTTDAIHTNDEKLLPALADELLIYDVAGTRLARATVANILSNTGANVPSVNGLANADISINPNDGVTVSGKVYNSANGVLVTVTTAPDLHGLTSGQFVQVTATDGNYSGTYQVTVTSTTTFTYSVSMNTVWNKTATNVYGSTLVTVASVGHGLANGQSIIVSGPVTALNGTYGITISGADAFTYVLSSAPYTATIPATTLTTTVNYIRNGYIAGSGTCSYTKKKSVSVVGNESISGKLYVDGDISTNGLVNASAMKVGGPVNVDGTINVTGNVSADTVTVGGKTVQTLVSEGSTTIIKSDVGSCKAWAKINGYSPWALINGHNISSITRTSQGSSGIWVVNFTKPFADANYVVTGTCSWPSNLDGNIRAFVNILTQTTSSVSFSVCSPAGYGGGHLDVECSFINLVVFGNQ